MTSTGETVVPLWGGSCSREHGTPKLMSINKGGTAENSDGLEEVHAPAARPASFAFPSTVVLCSRY